MSSPVDLDNIEGETLNDQDGRSIGKIKEVCGKDGDGEPMWVVVDASFGLMQKRVVIVPVARMKEEQDAILVPYSLKHVQASPEIEPSDELSAEDDRALRDHYGIDRADQELRADNESYASRVVDGPGTPPEESYEVDEDAAAKAMEKDEKSEGSSDDSEGSSSEDDGESEESEDGSGEDSQDGSGEDSQDGEERPHDEGEDASGEGKDDGPSAFDERFEGSESEESSSSSESGETSGEGESSSEERGESSSEERGESSSEERGESASEERGESA